MMQNLFKSLLGFGLMLLFFACNQGGKDSAAESEMAKNLIGTWQSTDDPKSVVKIADGKYIDEYDGKEVSSLPYIFYPACPKDCNPVGAIPCLKLVGQDDVCYTLVNVDAKNLELSLISGRGNTNRYVRK